MPVFSAIVKWSARAIGNSPLIFIIQELKGHYSEMRITVTSIFNIAIYQFQSHTAFPIIIL